VVLLLSSMVVCMQALQLDAVGPASLMYSMCHIQMFSVQIAWVGSLCAALCNCRQVAAHKLHYRRCGSSHIVCTETYMHTETWCLQLSCNHPVPVCWPAPTFCSSLA
jgi:hypothetical protein